MKIKHIFIFFLLVFFKMHIFSSTLLLPNNVSFILNYKKLSIPVAIVFLAGLVLHDWNKNLLARKKKNYNTIKKILTLFSEAADESAEKKILSIFFLHKGKTDQKSEHLKEKLNIINSMNRELLRQNNDSLKSKEINNILKNIVDQKILLLYKIHLFFFYNICGYTVAPKERTLRFYELNQILVGLLFFIID